MALVDSAGHTALEWIAGVTGHPCGIHCGQHLQQLQLQGRICPHVSESHANPVLQLTKQD